MHEDLTALLTDTAKRSAEYLSSLDRRSVAPASEAIEMINQLRGPLPTCRMDAGDVVAMLDRVGSPATMASAGARYFGFVTGSALPASLAANWLAGAWDQNAAFHATSPIGAAIEEIAISWLIELLHLPTCVTGAFVTGATMANFSALAAARTALLARKGWDARTKGTWGAPLIKIVAGGEVHVSVLKAITLLGFGLEQVTLVPVDPQGRMKATELPELDDTTIVCIQAGNVNTGAYDPASEICARARAAGAWVHVDGAFGLWVRSSAKLFHLAADFEAADSWATDAHKWLNTPYDCGLVFVRNGDALKQTMAAGASYLLQSGGREPCQLTPELSRRARGIEVWAAIQSLGSQGVAELVERCCDNASLMGRRVSDAGFDVLNDVIINQVLVSFGGASRTKLIIEDVQRDGTCWCGGTEWQGRTAMRVSVASWRTEPEDINRAADAIIRIAARHA